jgi:hypothetical protein
MSCPKVAGRHDPQWPVESSLPLQHTSHLPVPSSFWLSTPKYKTPAFHAGVFHLYSVFDRMKVAL